MEEQERLKQGARIILLSPRNPPKNSSPTPPAADQQLLSDLIQLCFAGHVNDHVNVILPKMQAYWDAHGAEIRQQIQDNNNNNDETAAFFEIMMARLQAFREQHGHAHVSPADDFELAAWIRWQKHLMHSFELPVDAQLQLAKIQFDFRDGSDDWDTNMYGWDTRRAT